MTYLANYGKRVWLPIYVFYLEGGDKTILVDTGLEEFMVPPGWRGLRPRHPELRAGPGHGGAEAGGRRRHRPHPPARRPLRERRPVREGQGLRAAGRARRVTNPHPIEYRYFPELLDGVTWCP